MKEITFGAGECSDLGYWEKPCLPCAKRWKTAHPDDDVWPNEDLPPKEVDSA